MDPSPTERFERQVDRTGDHHLWTGARHPQRGTGRLKVGGRQVTAHRYAWELAHGDLPGGARVLACPDQPACVRVEHLTLDGTPTVGASSRRAPKGAGSKREVRPGVWQLTVNAGLDADGEARRAFQTVSGTRAEAARALAALVAGVGDGRDLPSRADRGRTLGDLIPEYLHHLEHHKGRKHSTLVRYRGLADTWILPTLGHQRADRLVPRDLESALGAMRTTGLSQSSIHQTFTLLNGTYKWARRNRYLTHNPMTDTEEPRSAAVPHEVVPPDVGDLRRLLATAFAQEPDFGVLCHLGAVTGMRRGELAGLRWDRVDLAEGRIRVEVTVNDAGGQVVIDNFTKTRKTRAVSIDARTIELLTQHRTTMAKRAAPRRDRDGARRICVQPLPRLRHPHPARIPDASHAAAPQAPRPRRRRHRHHPSGPAPLDPDHPHRGPLRLPPGRRPRRPLRTGHASGLRPPHHHR